MIWRNIDTPGFSDLKNFFDSIAADIYICDAESRTLLFCNKAMRTAEKRLRRLSKTERCWQVLYGRNTPCPHCQFEAAIETQGKPVRSVGESRRPGQRAQHTDCIVQWENGRQGHMRFSLGLPDAQPERGLPRRTEQALLEIAVRFSTSGALQENIRHALGVLARAFKAPGTALLSLHETQHTYHCVATHTAGNAPFPADPFRNGPIKASSYVYLRLAAGKPVVGTADDRARSFVHFNLARQLGAQSVMAVPVFVQGRLWGCLCACETACARVFGADDTALCEAVAGILGAAIGRDAAQQTLAVAQQHLRLMLDHIPDAIFWKDNALHYLGCNRAFEDFYRVAEPEILGKSIYEVMPIYYADEAAKMEKSLILSGEAPTPTIKRTMNMRGQERWVRTQLIPVRGESQKPDGLLGISEDVTNEVLYVAEIAAKDEALRKNTEAAQQASAAKSEFLSRISHEIRTPLNAVIGMAQAAQDAEDIAQMRHCVNRIDTAAKALMNLVNEVLDMSKIEADKMVLTRTDFDFEEMLEHVFAIVGIPAQAKHIHLGIDLDPAIPQRLRGDSNRFSQVLINLLSNSIKFTPGHSEVLLRARLEKRGAGTVTLRCDVADTGIGLTPQQCEHLFEPYEQVPGAAEGMRTGTGLGLPIAKRIVHLMGGEMGVRSAVGKGSVFSFTAVLEEAAAPVSAPVAAKERQAGGAGEPQPPGHRPSGRANTPNFAGLRILLAEDVAVNREVLHHFLHKTGLQIDDATDGAEALMLYRQHHNHYSLVLMDVQMPKMDGLEATAAIRAFEREGGFARVPIYAMTAAAFGRDVEACLAAGMDGHVAKPLDRDKVLRLLAELLPVKEPATIPRPPEANSATPPETRIPPTGETTATAEAASAAPQTPPPAGEQRAHPASSLVDDTRIDSRYVNVEQGLQRVLDDAPFYAELLRGFRHTGEMADIAALYQQADYGALQKRLHALKGVALNFALDALYQRIQLLESALAQGDESAGAYTGLMRCYTDTLIQIDCAVAVLETQGAQPKSTL